MKKIAFWILLLQLPALCSGKVEERDEIRKVLHFAIPGAMNEILVDNLNGSISVTGTSGDAVQLSVEKTIQARSQAKIEQARQDVTLEITEDQNRISLYVDGPFRNSKGEINYRGSEYYGYEVFYEFELKVPYQTNLILKTINDGDISVENTTENYELNNINGSIRMLNVSGAGRVYALNGGVTVHFSQNPQGDSYYGSLNGQVHLYFHDPLEAEFRLKTFNGEVFSDFPMNYSNKNSIKKVKKNGKKIYKCERSFGVRAGNGGPEIELDAFNGDIFIHKHKK